MRGRVVDYNFQTSSGVISGSDGGRYTFYRAEWRKPEEPARGTVVDFVVSDGVAKSVYPLQGSDATLPGRPVPPRPNAGQAQGQAQGQARQQAGTGPTRGAYAGAAPQQGSGTGLREVGFVLGFGLIGGTIGVFLGLGLAIGLAFFAIVAFNATEDTAGGLGLVTWIVAIVLTAVGGAYFGFKRASQSRAPNPGPRM